jgi:predicted nucleic acid-binding protein
MRVVFADTVYWIALANPQDSLFKIASDAARRFGPYRIITSEMVLVEVLNGLAGEGGLLRWAASALAQDVIDDQDTVMVPQSTSLFREALVLYQARSDKQWSLTDCASFLIMRQQKITEALTYDHHFEQAGFRALLRN